MFALHTEKVFEDAIEAHLLQHGYIQGKKVDYNIDLALDTVQLITFITDSQPKAWAKLSTTHGDQVETKFLTRLAKELDSRGTLDVLRHGITDYGVHFQLAHFKPAHSLSPELVALYGKNRLSVTRQLIYSHKHNNELDLTLFVNGLPVATAELKSALTNLSVSDAIDQYRTTRDPKDLLLSFKKRALVHFAVDTDDVYMTTRLAGPKTIFLPFNKGHDAGAGNPDNPHGYKTAYLWEEIWERDSWLDILNRFIHMERYDTGKTSQQESIIFPRYHQLDAVRTSEAHAKAHGTGYNYLIQHSAGSGKSNTIAWLAHRLSNLHNATDAAVFDSVIVITDRRVLDKQLQDTIYQFEHKQGVVVKIDQHSDQLADALVSGKRIIITTLQKFPFVLEKTGRIAGRHFAVIVDEAHSSQTGEGAKKLKDVLRIPDMTSDNALATAERADETGEYDVEDEIAQSMQSRGRQKNLSFFAFTATPKAKTLEIFGTMGADGKPHPFHLYSMRQAIEEGFILDVLKNYVTYKMYFKLEQARQDDPEVDAKKAGKAIARFVHLHPHNIAQKTEMIIEHFRTFSVHKIGGKAKAMVVTRSRLHAVRYKRAFDQYIKEKGYTDIKVLVAFSGTVDDGRAEYTESGMNGFGERQVPEKFKSDEYQVLIVAEKYQTGFDEPLLHSMYVDKKLDGVKAVQTLSRLNRTHPGKEDTFILDFVNDAETIKEAFEPFYEVTAIEEPTDPNLLYDLKSTLDGKLVYWLEEVNAFARAFFTPTSLRSPATQKALHAALDPAVSRYRDLDTDVQDEFKAQLMSFTRLYSFLSQIVSFHDADLERLYVFGRFLLLKLPHRDDSGAVDLGDDVALQYYRLAKTSDGDIELGLDGGTLTGPTDVGTGGGYESVKEHLSTIIGILNEKFGTDFTAADQLTFDQIEEELVANNDLAQQAQANSIDNYSYGFDEAFIDAVIDRKSQNEEIFTRILDDDAFAKAVRGALLAKVYHRQNTP